MTIILDIGESVSVDYGEGSGLAEVRPSNPGIVSVFLSTDRNAYRVQGRSEGETTLWISDRIGVHEQPVRVFRGVAAIPVIPGVRWRPSANSVQVLWDIPERVRLSGFRVKIREGERNGPPWDEIISVSRFENSAIIQGLSPGAIHFVEVVGFNPGGEGPAGAFFAFETLQGPAGAPENVRLSSDGAASPSAVIVWDRTEIGARADRFWTRISDGLDAAPSSPDTHRVDPASWGPWARTDSVDARFNPLPTRHAFAGTFDLTKFYFAEVYAENALGRSASVRTHSLLRDAVGGPLPPTLTLAQGTPASTQVVASWVFAADGPAANIAYTTLQWRPVGSTAWTTHEGPRSPLGITTTAGAAIEVRVRAGRVLADGTTVVRGEYTEIASIQLPSATPLGESPAPSLADESDSDHPSRIIATLPALAAGQASWRIRHRLSGTGAAWTETAALAPGTSIIAASPGLHEAQQRRVAAPNYLDGPWSTTSRVNVRERLPKPPMPSDADGVSTVVYLGPEGTGSRKYRVPRPSLVNGMTAWRVRTRPRPNDPATIHPPYGPQSPPHPASLEEDANVVHPSASGPVLFAVRRVPLTGSEDFRSSAWSENQTLARLQAPAAPALSPTPFQTHTIYVVRRPPLVPGQTGWRIRYRAGSGMTVRHPEGRMPAIPAATETYQIPAGVPLGTEINVQVRADAGTNSDGYTASDWSPTASGLRS